VTDWSGGSERYGSWYGNRFLFQGREYFPELGLYDYRNRFYHPILGRFLQTDPSGFDGGDMNLFRYCGDDPVDGSDPTGLVDTRTIEYGHLTHLGGSDTGRANNPPDEPAGIIYAPIALNDKDEGKKGDVKVTGGFKELRPAQDAAVHADYDKIDKSGIGRKDRPEYGGYLLRRKDRRGDTEYGYSGPYKGKQGPVEDKYRKMRQANYLVLVGPGALPVPAGWTKIGWHYAHPVPGNTIPQPDKNVARDHGFVAVGAAPPLRRGAYYNPRIPMIEYYP
jgi:RHS repeat-associated protein